MAVIDPHMVVLPLTDMVVSFEILNPPPPCFSFAQFSFLSPPHPLPHLFLLYTGRHLLTSFNLMRVRQEEDEGVGVDGVGGVAVVVCNCCCAVAVLAMLLLWRVSVPML